MPHHSKLLAAIVVFAGWLGACGGSTGSDPAGSGGAGGSAATGGSAGASPGCPTSLPVAFSSCSLPSGTSCWIDVGGCCPATEAKCMSGKWEVYPSGCGAPAPPPCPADPPANGSSCATEPCAGAYGTCVYDTCLEGGSYISVQCNGSTWSWLPAQKCPPVACEGLAPCDCFKTQGCQAVTDTCICPCDYACPGEPPCQCACGGGAYLGCEPIAG